MPTLQEFERACNEAVKNAEKPEGLFGGGNRAFTKSQANFYSALEQIATEAVKSNRPDLILGYRRTAQATEFHMLRAAAKVGLERLVAFDEGMAKAEPIRIKLQLNEDPYLTSASKELAEQQVQLIPELLSMAGNSAPKPQRETALSMARRHVVEHRAEQLDEAVVDLLKDISGEYGATVSQQEFKTRLVSQLNADELKLNRPQLWTDSQGNGLAHYVAEKARPDLLEILPQFGVNVDQVNAEGLTPLCALCAQSNAKLLPEQAHAALQTVSKLIDKGADPNHQTATGKTPLDLACSSLSTTDNKYGKALIQDIRTRGGQLNKVQLAQLGGDAKSAWQLGGEIFTAKKQTQFVETFVNTPQLNAEKQSAAVSHPQASSFRAISSRNTPSPDYLSFASPSETIAPSPTSSTGTHTPRPPTTPKPEKMRPRSGREAKGM